MSGESAARGTILQNNNFVLDRPERMIMYRSILDPYLGRKDLSNAEEEAFKTIILDHAKWNGFVKTIKNHGVPVKFRAALQDLPSAPYSKQIR